MQDREFAVSELRQLSAHDTLDKGLVRPWSADDWRGEFRVSHNASTDAAFAPSQFGTTTSLGSSGLALANSLIAHSSLTTLEHVLDAKGASAPAPDSADSNFHFDNHIAPALVELVSQLRASNATAQQMSHGGFSPSFNLPPPTTQSGGLTINITYDSSVTSAPAGFKTAVAAAVSYLESQFNDPITINIHVGWGEVHGSSISSGALGESSTSLFGFSYTDLRNALIADKTSADDTTAVNTLGATDPTSGGTFLVSVAEARALGLTAASDSTVDGYVGFDSTANFDYDNSNGVSPGSYDFYDVVLHEITEVMGRQTANGSSNQYEALDLFHYSAPGTPIFSGTTAGYFSINGGTTDLKDFSTDPSGDFGDWANSAGNDAFLAFSGPGVVNGVSSADLKEMDILGYNRVTGSAPDLTTTGATLTGSTLAFAINNVGTATAAASTAGIYLSADSTITTADTRINTHSTPSLAAGASNNESVALALPTNLTPGTYFLGVIADYSNVVAESNESNNKSTAIRVILGNDSANTISGTSGNNVIFALGGNDTISPGAGNDTINAGDGNDTINIGANFTSADQIDGGVGTDSVSLNGDYSAGLTFGAATMVNVETLHLVTGHSYTLTMNDANVAASQTLKVDASTLGASDVLTFNGGSETNGFFNILGGAGNDVINMGAAMNATDKINGGAGNDTVSLNGNYASLVFAAGTMTNVETLKVAAGHNYSITTNSGVLTTGQTLTVIASALASGNSLTFNGAAVTAGSFVFKPGQGADHLTGGGGADTFVYTSVNLSTSTHYDTIGKFDFSADKFDLSFAVGGIDTALTTGALNTASFDSDLTAALNGHLNGHHAILFTPDSGTLSGQTFLVVDANNTAGYQASADLVFHMTNATGTLAVSDFI